MTPFKNTRNQLGTVLMLGALVAATGCGGDSNANATAPGLSNTAADGAPTVTELQSRLDLTAEQSVVVESALITWRDAMSKRPNRESMQRGEGPAPGWEPPVLAFLEQSADVLSQEQFLELTEVLAEKRDAHRETMQAKFKNRAGERQHKGSARGGERAQLDPEVRQAVGELHQAQREARHAAMEAFKTSGDAEALRTSLKASRDQFKASLAQVVDADQLAQFESRKGDLKAKGAARRAENTDTRAARRAEFLTRVLQLDASQASAVQALLQAEKPGEQVDLDAVADGSVDPIDAFVDGLVRKQQLGQALRAELNPEQQARFDALKELMPRPHRGGPRR